MRSRVRFGSLRRLTPISRDWGYDRGTPIDRYYIADFLNGHGLAGTREIRGHLLEIEWDLYAREFGGWGERDSPVERVDILHVNESNPAATIVADLVAGDGVPSDTFDCVICTQTLQFIYDVRAAVGTLHRALKPGGVLLATSSGISHAAQPDLDLWGDYWRFTTRSARRLFQDVFSTDDVQVQAYGNVLSATAFLQGMAVEELRPHELEFHDPRYELIVGVRAVKNRAQPPRASTPPSAQADPRS